MERRSHGLTLPRLWACTGLAQFLISMYIVFPVHVTGGARRASVGPGAHKLVTVLGHI